MTQLTEDEKIEQSKTEIAKAQPTEIEKALAARAKAAAERLAKAEARRRSPAQLAEIERLEKLAEASEVLADIESKHGAARCALVDTIGGPVVLMRGEEVVYRRFKTACEKAGKHPISDQALRDYAFSSMHFPAGDEAKAFLDQFPAVVAEICIEVSKLFGAKVGEDQGK